MPCGRFGDRMILSIRNRFWQLAFCKDVTRDVLVVGCVVAKPRNTVMGVEHDNRLVEFLSHNVEIFQRLDFVIVTEKVLHKENGSNPFPGSAFDSAIVEIVPVEINVRFFFMSLPQNCKGLNRWLRPRTA